MPGTAGPLTTGGTVMEQGDAAPVRAAQGGDAARTRRLALALLLRLAAAAAALTVLLGVVLLVTQARGQDMFPAVKDGAICSSPTGCSAGGDRTISCCTGRGIRCAWGRVAAAGGDVVLLDDSGELRVNGTLHTGEIPYATYPAEGLTYPYTVPEGHLFLLCDHRTQGRDSRHFGAVPEDSVAGKVITLLRRRGL